MDGLDFKATAITKSSPKLISVWKLSFINLSVNSYWVLAESLNLALENKKKNGASAPLSCVDNCSGNYPSLNNKTYGCC